MRRLYTVQAGDFPARIAEKLAKSAGRHPELLTANPAKRNTFGRWTGLRVDERLQVPASWPDHPLALCVADDAGETLAPVPPPVPTPTPTTNPTPALLPALHRQVVHEGALALLRAWRERYPSDPLDDARRALLLGHVWFESKFGRLHTATLSAPWSEMEGTHNWGAMQCTDAFRKAHGIGRAAGESVPLVALPGVHTAMPQLAAPAAKAFAAVRDELQRATGRDLFARLGDALRVPEFTTDKAGTIFQSWHKAGRAIDLDQGAPFRRLAEPGGLTRLFVGDVDVTAALAARGWNRIPGEWWHYERRDGLTWADAMAQVWPAARLRAAFPGVVFGPDSDGFGCFQHLDHDAQGNAHTWEYRKYPNQYEAAKDYLAALDRPAVHAALRTGTAEALARGLYAVGWYTGTPSWEPDRPAVYAKHLYGSVEYVRRALSQPPPPGTGALLGGGGLVGLVGLVALALAAYALSEVV